MASEGPLSPGTMADDTTVGTLIWNTPNNAKISDNVTTSISTTSISYVYSHYLKATNLGFSIPAGATIDGILVEIERHRGTKGEGWDEAVKIVKSDGSIGATNKASGTQWVTDTNIYYSYGGATDLWGETWTDTDINDVDFGAVLEVKIKLVSGPGSQFCYVDHMRITVYYTAGGGGTNMQINIGDAWKSVSAAKINIGDVWKTVAAAKINIGDAWKTIF